MPRRPLKKKEKITIVVDGIPVVVTMHPPTGSRKSWYAYWTGLITSRSTGHLEFSEAVEVVETMLRNGGKRNCIRDSVLSDDEFIEIQRRHYAKKTGPEARKRSEKSLRECLDAIRAFREISGVAPITLATADDCERFQRDAIEKPKNWRLHYADTGRSKKRREERIVTEKLSPNTILKWSVALQAAYERANRNGGKKCVRGVVPEAKLLTENPWKNFTWIEGFQRKLRQFDHSELLSLLAYFDSIWPGVSFAPAFVKVMLWSWARRLEVSSLRWTDERRSGQESHFESTGKWGVTKWFRVPDALRNDLELLKNGSEFVFGCYPEQLRDFHLRRGDSFAARQVRQDFTPENVGEWMYRQVFEWSQSLPKGAAYLHVFRKTALQHALSGEHIEQAVAEEASVTPAVMRASYARASDEEFRRMSNRTFRRIRSSLPVDVATRYGYEEKPADRLMEQLDLARSQGDWKTVARLAKELSSFGPQPA
jgi:hypothetical protein